MRTSITILALVLVAVCMVLNAADVQASNTVSGTSVRFTQNMGQWPDDILFRTSSGGVTMWIARGGIYYQLTRVISRPEPGNGSSAAAVGPAMSIPSAAHRQTDSIETMAVKASFMRANPAPSVVVENEQAGKTSYFLGNDQTKWRTDVPSYEAVTLKDIYPGVDIRFSGSADGKPTYQYALAADAKSDEIRIAYEGLSGSSCDAAGIMTATTAWGDVSGMLAKPGAQVAVSLAAVSPIASTATASESGSKVTTDSHRRDLAFAFSTYLGGEGPDYGTAVAIDGADYVYVAGTTSSVGFPVVSNLGSAVPGATGVFVTKLSPGGDAMVYSAFLGGSSGSECGWGIAVDPSGCAYIEGYTYSSDFPVLNGYSGVSQGGYEAFVTKLAPAGNALVYSTYLGGSANDYAYTLAVDPSGSAYVAGMTNSYDYPIVNGYDNLLVGPYAGFITKLTPDGSGILYSTFLGGSGQDEIYGLALDATGEACVTGLVRSADFPIVNAYQRKRGGTSDAFVSKLSADGSALLFSTYLGGSSGEWGKGIAVDGAGNIIVGGSTCSPDFRTLNAPQAKFGGGGTDGFVAKISPNDGRLLYSTFIGGSLEESVFGIALDATGSAYAIGKLNSPDFPVVMGYISHHPGYPIYYDGFVAKLIPSGYAFAYCTVISADRDTEGWAIAVDALGNVHVTGKTTSSDLAGSGFQPWWSGSWDGFAMGIQAYASCCVGTTGNVDGSPDDVVDISDVLALVDFLSSSTPLSSCAGENDVDRDGVVTISDLYAVIDFVQGAARLLDCPI